MSEDFTKLIYPELSYKINGILFNVHNELGRFYNEKQYCDAIENRLKNLGLSYEREKILSPAFAEEMQGRNKTDFLVEDKIVLEIKTKKFLTRDDYYQVKRYLSVLNKKLGILVNFHRKYIEPKRILNSSAKE
jgi:GxxExxY protein